MARRATLDRGAPRTAPEEAALDEALPMESARARPLPARPWRGAGGRWVVWTLRGVVWLVLLVVGYRGVTAIVTGSSATTPAAAPAVSATPAFPSALAQAYALQFGSVYLDYSPAAASRRAAQLAAFLPSGSDAQLGWNGAGTQRLQSEEVAAIQVHGPHSAVVTLLARVGDHMLELGVPVYYDAGALVVAGEPALLPAPARAVMPDVATENSDAATVTALQRQLPAFFEAYASGDPVTLGRFLAAGASVTGLGGSVTFGSIQSVTAPYGGATRRIIVSVVWHVTPAASTSSTPSSGVSAAPAALQMTYGMTVVRQGTSWYVRSIGASPQSPGPP